MEKCTYLLVGGGLASARAAKQLKSSDPSTSITILSVEPHLPYDRPPLSKEFMRGQKSEEDILLEKESFYAEQGINVLLGKRASSLNAKDKIATTEDGLEIGFEKALLATGGRPKRLPIPGAELDGVHYLRTIENSQAIAKEGVPGRRGVIVGGGFIGMEIAASLTQLGAEVTVIEMAPYIWSRFLDETTAKYFQSYYQDKGISFFTNESVQQLHGQGVVASVETKSGKRIECDFVCVGVGIDLNDELAKEAGLEVGNGVLVNEGMQTSHPDIYAAGDIANYYDPIFGKRRRVEHWGHAEYTGQLAAENMAGAGKTYDLLTYVFSDIFDLRLEFAGDETEYEKILIRGTFEENSFVVLYMKDGKLTAYLSVNTSPREFIPMQRLIRRKIDLSSNLNNLTDKSFDLRKLLQQG